MVKLIFTQIANDIACIWNILAYFFFHILAYINIDYYSIDRNKIENIL